MPHAAANSIPVLVADIGGTNARFACLDLASDYWFGQWTGPVEDYPDIYAAIEMAKLQVPAVREVQAVCIAVAAPVHEDWVDVSNASWAFSQAELQRHFGWAQLTVINDFHAAAYGVITLSPSQYMALGKASPENMQLPSAVVGPGTGLGIAGLFPDEQPEGRYAWSALGTEGGHARFAPVDEEEIALLQVLREMLGCVQREDILSGRGLCNLYQALARVQGIDAPPVLNPAVITAQALTDPNSHSAKVLERFCAILGTVAADVALDLGTRGTLFLAGGILPRIADFLVDSPFRKRFEDHLRFSHYLRSIDTVLVMEKRLGLIGAAYRLRRQLQLPASLTRTPP